MNGRRAVVVEGVEIPEALIAQEAQNHPSLSAAEAWTASARALAVKALLLHRAHALGLKAQPEFDAGGREETEDEALIRAVLDAEVSVEPPTEEQCRRVYATRRDRFQTPVLYEAAHILLQPQDDSPQAVEEARGAAEALIARLQANPHAFADLAAMASDCGSGKTGGSLGQLRAGDLAPEVEAALLQMTPGTVRDMPVRSRFGWHILKLERRIEAGQLPYEAVVERIHLELEARAWTVAAANYAARLASEARLQGVSLSLAPDGALSDGSLVLGDLLGDGEMGGRAHAWLAAVDPALADRVNAAAEKAQVSAADFIDRAVADFVAEADDERWTNLISAAQGAEDAALAAVSNILRSKLTPAKQAFTLIRRRGA